MERDNSTANTILMLLLVIVVGFIVWYVMDQRQVDEPVTESDEPGLEIRLETGEDDA